LETELHYGQLLQLYMQ